MVEDTGNIWNYSNNITKCITTNGIVKKNNELVMGKGIALQAKKRYPDIPKILGDFVKLNGNILYYIKKYNIISFPTKHHWKDKSSIELIKQSCYTLNYFTESFNKLAVLPKPGCENGGLDWESEVKPIISKILNNRICVISL